MSSLNPHEPAVAQRIQPLIEAKDAEGLHNVMNALDWVIIGLNDARLTIHEESPNAAKALEAIDKRVSVHMALWERAYQAKKQIRDEQREARDKVIAALIPDVPKAVAVCRSILRWQPLGEASNA
jgi:hypothetical protein